LKKKLISIITPVYNEEKNIPVFYEEVFNVVRTLPYNFEIIFVDDGSRDSSAEAVKQLRSQLIDIKLLQLSRNFGKEIATTAGITESSGDAAIIIDSDLQHPVEKIPEFIKRWEKGFDVVVGVRSAHAHANKIKEWGSKMFYKILNQISETEIVPHTTDYRLIDRQVINEFKKFTERKRITRGLIDWLGFHRDFLYFEAKERMHGKPSYTFKKLLALAINSFTSHSLFPLRLAGYLGVFTLSISGIGGTFIAINRYVFKDPLNLNVSNIVMLAILLVFLIGIVLACLGLMSLYIANIHGEVTNRPLYVLKKDRRYEDSVI
jgi:glycosyltransferase involved in cell wall biosynthesis